MAFLLLCSCVSPQSRDVAQEVEKKSCFDLIPDGPIDDMIDFLSDGGLTDFACGDMTERHTDYADFFTLSDIDTVGGSMQVVVAWNTSTHKVYDLSYYWHLTKEGEDAQDVFGSMETKALTRFGVPSSQRVQNDDGYGTHYITTTWEPTTTQGYSVCLELSYDFDGNPPLLMLEVTNPANEF